MACYAYFPFDLHISMSFICHLPYFAVISLCYRILVYLLCFFFLTIRFSCHAMSLWGTCFVESGTFPITMGHALALLIILVYFFTQYITWVDNCVKKSGFVIWLYIFLVWTYYEIYLFQSFFIIQKIILLQINILFLLFL